MIIPGKKQTKRLKRKRPVHSPMGKKRPYSKGEEGGQVRRGGEDPTFRKGKKATKFLSTERGKEKDDRKGDLSPLNDSQDVR